MFENKILKLNEYAKRSWLIIAIDCVNHDTKRKIDGTPLSICDNKYKYTSTNYLGRLRLICDGFTYFDAQIIDNEKLKIQSNMPWITYQNFKNKCTGAFKATLEDNIFINPEFMPGMIINFDTFENLCIKYIDLSLERIKRI